MKFCSYIFSFFLISSCSAPQVAYDYDENANFSQIVSYQLYPDLQSGLNQLDEQRVVSILAELLPESGLILTETPQILVNFYSEEYETTSRNSLGIGVGGGGGNIGVGVSGGIPLGGPENHLRLILDFIDAEKDSLIWQAVVEGNFDKSYSPKEKESRLRDMIKKALKGYPPKM